MDELQTGIIALIKSALTGEKAEVSENFDWDNALNTAKEHQITPLIYYGVRYSGLEPPSEIMQFLELATYKNIAVSQNQLYALEGIYKAFDENRIDYMPLKGSVLKFIYPKPEMRSMGDADILIKLEQYKKIENILPALSYERKSESDHELVWRSPSLYLELHKRLFSRQNKDYYSYFGDGWKNAIKESETSTRYSLNIEDQYIYIFVHFVKHYRIGGIGLRHLIDLWVYEKHYKNIDKSKIESALRKINLFEFYSNVQHLLDNCFGSGKGDAITDYILDTVFSNGSFGNAETRNVAPSIRERINGASAKNVAKFRTLKACFPSLSTMKSKYRVLTKVPILLPLMWLFRLFNILVFKRKKIPQYLDNVNDISANVLKKYEEGLKYVGLDFNFKE